MGNLPEQRLTHKHPFDVVGVDYAGPFQIKDRMGRGAKLLKSYVALKSLFLGQSGAYRTNNGSNFLGAHIELGRFIRDKLDDKSNKLNNEEVDWHFIPSHSPHFGGMREAGVKTMKGHLNRVVSNTPLTFEQFYTLLSEVGAIMNCRSLSALSSSPKDFTPLTPAHFLIGRQISPIASLDIRSLPVNRLSLYQHLQQMKQHIWARWSKEYISELQQRNKWKQNCHNWKVGEIVLIKDDNKPPMKWKMGKVLEMFVGKDNVARVALLKTEMGNLKRSFSKICPLPINR
ncbi:uncharacterized protein LOC130904222 [Diorhabda carinulata]|uniref:uncharacterized protein LOC130904222 n=1 Tax=Diorhabda carinulata TaxID=1163345 RepID=UPI0025A1C8B1|nr:uncharacterized protein LOC130904222 [Diorhabda carinulata]